MANIRAVDRPLHVVAGRGDEVFNADLFAGVFKIAGKEVPVTLLADIGHISLTLDSKAIDASVDGVRSMNESKASAEFSRQSDDEFGTIRAASHVNIATVRFDNPFHDGHSKASSFGLGCKERLEYVRLLLRAES